MRYLLRYNDQGHHAEKHSGLEDWLANLPSDGLRDMCTWDQFCRFAREPERRKVGIDARIAIGGTTYEVEPGMAGEAVVLLWGLFDDEMYVEFDGEKFGPYHPVSGPIPLYRHRAFKRGKADEPAERIHALADQIGLPISALAGNDVHLAPSAAAIPLAHQPFDADAHEYRFPSIIAAKLAIADELATPLTRLSAEDRVFIDHVLAETLMRNVVIARVREYFRRYKNSGGIMRVEVMEHFGLTVPLNQAGYYETEHHKELMKDIRGAINEGRLIAVCGLIGSGKTVTLRRLQQMLEEEKKITVSRSHAIDKHKVNLATLRAALFYDLSTEKNVRVPTGVERSERELLDLLKKNKRSIALFVDEGHDLNGHTLIWLKRLMELFEHGDGKLSVVLAGHPKLKNDLQRPTMEEIGFRTEVFSLDRITGSQREYIQWLLAVCTQGRSQAESILAEDAIDLLATKLRTPLQVQRYLTLAFEAAYQIGRNPYLPKWSSQCYRDRLTTWSQH